MRGFEKIGFEQFSKDIKDDLDLYNEYSLPFRSTKNSAGYDFYLIEDIVLEPNQVIKIPTGIKAYCQESEFLMLVVRSNVGFKYNVRLTNQVGIIDADYYNNPSNEGHIYISIQNHGDSVFEIHKGERIVQGIFTKYLTVDEDVSTKERKSWTWKEGEDNNE